MGATNCSSCGCGDEQELRNTATIQPHHFSSTGYAAGPANPPALGPGGHGHGFGGSNGVGKHAALEHPVDTRSHSHGMSDRPALDLSTNRDYASALDHGNADLHGLEANPDHQETRVEKLQDGSVFEGQFRGRDRHGFGKFVWSAGGSYEGQFDTNDMHGQGVYTWGDGSQYTGQWQRNNMGPEGTMIWTDGRKYDGQFRDGKKHGEGTLMWPDGRSYVGQWEFGKQHGAGTTVTGKGISRKSQWEHGKLVKWLDDQGAPDVGGTR